MTIDDRIEAAYDECVLRFDEDAGDGRTLTGHVVPWDKAAFVARPIRGYESFKRGALTRSYTEAKRPIPLLGLHRESDPIGKLIHSVDDGSGQFAVFRLLDTAAARDAAELIREGIWRSFSVGGYGIPARTKLGKTPTGDVTIERAEIRWDHVGLVRKPAFDDARVLALRDDGSAGDVPPPSPADLAAVVEARRRRRQRLLHP